MHGLRLVLTVFLSSCCSFSTLAGQSSTLAGQSGSAARPIWDSSKLIGSPDPPLPYRVRRCFPGITFNQPVGIVALPGRSRILALQRDGQLLSFKHAHDADTLDPAGSVLDYEPNLAAGLDLTLDPKFESNGLVYLVWKGSPHFRNNGAKIVRFRLTDDEPPRLDPESQLVIYAWPSAGHADFAARQVGLR